MLNPFFPSALSTATPAAEEEADSCSCNAYCLEDFGSIETPAETTATLLAAASEAGVTGGIICLPPDITIGANPDTEVGADEGAGVVLTEAMSHLTFRGMGRGTTIKPVSNLIEMFVGLGAFDITFENIFFDNSDNGVLLNVFKPADKIPGGGRAGLGNAANAAIRQYQGRRWTVRNCWAAEWHTVFNYIGDYTDDQNLVGDAIVDRLYADGCVFAFLVEQAETIRYTNSGYVNGINSINGAGSPNNSDPGHGIYVANRLGAVPKSVIIDNIYGNNNLSFTTKVRKGEVVAANNINVLNCHRGVTFENCQPVVSNLNIKLANIFPSDDRAIGLKLVNAGNSQFQNVRVDISGCDAWAVKIIPTIDLDGTDPEDPQDTNPAAQDWWNVNNQLDGVTMINDLTASTDKRWLVAQNQVDLVLEEPTAYVTADTASDKPVVYIDNCVRAIVNRPKRKTAKAGDPVGSDLLVGITATSVDTTVEYSRSDLDVAPTPSTVNIAVGATGTKVFRVDGSLTESWVPAPTFVTPGDFAATNVTTTGSWIIRRGKEATVGCRLKFDCTQTTASGAFRITGFPYAADGFDNEFVNAVAMHKNLTLATDDVGVVIGNGETFFTLRTNAAGGAGVGPLVAANLPTTANVEIGFEITFRIVEP